MYSSQQGRWLSPDPLGGDITNPQSLNRYTYALNNPVTFSDRTGLCSNDDPSSVDDPGCGDCGGSAWVTDPSCPGPGGGGGSIGFPGPWDGGTAQNPQPPTDDGTATPPPGGFPDNGPLGPCNGDPTGCYGPDYWWILYAAGPPLFTISMQVKSQVPQTPETEPTEPHLPSCVGYFFLQTYLHSNPLTPDVAGSGGDFFGSWKTYIEWKKFQNWVPLKWSNMFRQRALSKAISRSVGKGLVAGILATADYAMLESLFDEYEAFKAGECQ